MAIINGYAQDMATYRNNNRVKAISVFISGREFMNVGLADDTLSWQIVETAQTGMSVSEIYPGIRYNDTCIAEFNICPEDYGWLFGDINE
jgi:hypothetical protein